MSDLGTLAGLHEHRHRLAAYCPRCERWADIGLDEMLAYAQGDRRLPKALDPTPSLAAT